MRYLWSLALALAGCAAMSDPAPLRISGDYGGPIAARVERVQALNDAGRHVVIAGDCFSACTLYLGLRDYCVLPEALFGFHGPVRADGQPMAGDDFARWSAIMATHYPERIAAWFLRYARHDGLTHTIAGGDLIAEGIVPACPPDHRSHPA